MDNEKITKITKNYVCEFCDYNTIRYSEYTRHLLTAKHKRITMDNAEITKNHEESKNYVCNCGKKYNYSSGLSKHKKKCIYENTSETATTKNIEELNDLKNLIKDLLSQNKVLVDTIKDITPKIGNTTISNNCNNTTNNQFNLQVFLNETCKDAMNIDDFAKSVAINMDDLYFTEKNGMTQGLITLIINKLKTMDITERPMHCTDLKREVIYVKKDKWVKDENNDIMKHTIYMVSAWQLFKLKEWINLHPDVYHNQESLDEFSKLANVLYKQVEGNDTINKKVLRSVADFIYIDKNSVCNLSKVT